MKLSDNFVIIDAEDCFFQVQTILGNYIPLIGKIVDLSVT